MPVHTLGNVVCFGQVSCSPPLMGLCAEKGVSLAFLLREQAISGPRGKAGFFPATCCLTASNCPAFSR